MKGRKIHIPLNIGTFIFGALFIYMAVSVGMYLTADHIQSYQVTAGPLAKNQIYNALVLREEQVVKAGTSGYITYYARNNTKVSESGVVYTLGDRQNQVETEELGEEDYAKIRSSMEGFASSFDQNNFYTAYTYKYRLEGDILRYRGLTGSDENTPQTIAGQTVYTAPQDGVLLYATDGYEDLDMNEVEASPELFRKTKYNFENLQHHTEITAGDPVYKLITSEKWSLLIPLTNEQTVQLSGRSSIRVRFLKDDATQVGKFTILTDADGNFYCKVTFEQGMIRYAEDRFLNVELVTNTRTGLKIPLTSIVRKDFYVIPAEYVSYNEEDGTVGLNKLVKRNKKTDTSEFVQTTLYGDTDSESEEEKYYVDLSAFKEGDQIIKPDSQSVYTIGDTVSLEGVYSINKGYAVFRRIRIIDQNDMYCIVETGTEYGIAQFDHIVRNGNSVHEDDILVDG